MSESHDGFIGLEREICKIINQATTFGITVYEAKGPEYPVIFVNQAFCLITGYTSEEVLGSPGNFITGAETNPETVQKIRQALAQGQSITVEILHYRKDGTPFWDELRLNFISRADGETSYIVGLHMDVTEQIVNEEKIHLYAKTAEHTQQSALITDGEQRVILVNPAFSQRTLYRMEEVLNRPLSDILTPERNREALKQMESAMWETGQWQGEVWVSCKSQEEYPAWFSISRIQDDRGKTTHFISLFSDISPLKTIAQRLEEYNRKLLYLTTVDGLTGISNRRHFDDVFNKEWKRSIRNGSPLSLIMLDIDDFKFLNDHYGHAQGDVCLKKVAAILVETLKRPGDVVSRYGGEEFVVLLPDTDLAGAQVVAEGLRANVEKMGLPHEYSRFKKVVTVSLGVVSGVPTVGTDLEGFLKLADSQLYRAKQDGRNCVRVAEWG